MRFRGREPCCAHPHAAGSGPLVPGGCWETGPGAHRCAAGLMGLMCSCPYVDTQPRGRIVGCGALEGRELRAWLGLGGCGQGSGAGSPASGGCRRELMHKRGAGPLPTAVFRGPVIAAPCCSHEVFKPSRRDVLFHQRNHKIAQARTVLSFAPPSLAEPGTHAALGGSVSWGSS